MQHGDSESAFRELLELAPEAVVIGNAAMRVVDANAAACRLFGYERYELLRLTTHDLLEPEEAAKFVRELPFEPGRVHVGEWHVKRRDATLVPVESSPKVLPDGRTMSFIRDISERKRAEREREELVSWLSEVLEQCPVALALLHGPRGERFQANGRVREWFGGHVDEPARREIQSRIRTLDGQPMSPEQLVSVRALRGERLARAEYLIPTSSGSVAHISVNAGPIVGRDGRVLGAVVACEDVTAEKELERLRAEWSSVVAHDLRQPLASISLNARAVSRFTRDPNVLKCAERVCAATDRLNRMVGDLMDLSRLEASRLELARRPVDIAAVVSAAAEQARLQSPDRPFEVRVHGSVPQVQADPDRIAQVLENLLTNAVKYGNAGTPVVMSVAAGGGQATVEVTNEGRPLAPVEIERMFQRFHRTESAKLQGIQGVGLGLYITRSLVEAHGGRIRVESTPDGMTKFSFTLPLTTAANDVPLHAFRM
jgi:PAS domain S-box-containing protein